MSFVVQRSVCFTDCDMSFGFLLLSGTAYYIILSSHFIAVLCKIKFVQSEPNFKIEANIRMLENVFKVCSIF